MVIRTFFDKNNTLIKNSYLNTGRNPVTELFYGGEGKSNQFSRFLFHFDPDNENKHSTIQCNVDINYATQVHNYIVDFQAC